MEAVSVVKKDAQAQRGYGVVVDKKLGLASIVLLAQSHNPSILSPEFLANKKIVEGNVSQFAHTQVVSVVEYKEKNVSINVTPENFALNFNGTITDESVKEIASIVRSYFSFLPETPITAVGVNFHGQLSFPSEAEALGFQEIWFKPPRLSDSLKDFKVSWGSTARLQLPKTGAWTTLKLEPNANPLSVSFFVNGHYDVKGTVAALEVLKDGPNEVLDFASSMMSKL